MVQTQAAVPARCRGPRLGEFVAHCPLTRRAAHDPIVGPGNANFWHSHDFFGNVTTDHLSTVVKRPYDPTKVTPFPHGLRMIDNLVLTFPNCWDGAHLDSANHKSHMLYGQALNCPMTHPVLVPEPVQRPTVTFHQHVG